MRHQLVEYSYLQMLDLLTTIAFLLHGVQEGNPLVRWAIQAAPSPVAGLLAVKLLALGLGGYCWFAGRSTLLKRINIAFAALVVWNLVSLIVQGA